MSTAAPLAHALWLRSAPSQRWLAALHAGGHDARFAGGCVRDGLLDPGLQFPDLDIATTATPEQVVAIAESAGFRSIPTGIAHGTVTVLVDETRFEVTTLRVDVTTDGRHAKVAYTDSFEADAARRDLTINAMSCDARGHLFDYFDGEADLRAGRIVFVGDPAERLAEDYLRILRYFRFFARFGRCEPPPTVLAAIASAVPGLARISGERIQQELRGLLTAPGAAAAAGLLARVGVTQALFGCDGDATGLARVTVSADWVIRLAIWLRGSPDGRAIAERLRLSVADRDDFLFWLTVVAPFWSWGADDRRRALYRHGRRRTTGLIHLHHACSAPALDIAAELAQLAAEPDPVMPLRGRDLLAIGVPPGRRIGDILAQVEAAWLASGCLLTHERCLDMARAELAK